MRPQWLSLHELRRSAQATLARFPLIALACAAGACLSIYLQSRSMANLPKGHWAQHGLMALALLIPMLFASAITGESGGRGWWPRVRYEVLALIIAFGYFSSLPRGDLRPYHESFFILYFALACLSPLVVHRLCRHDDDLFWDFHTSLLARGLLTGLYTGVLQLGTMAALAAIDALFQTHLMRMVAPKLSLLILWLFASLFFLAGVPGAAEGWGRQDRKPRWIRNIVLYILVPLNAVYLGILYAYLLKIMAQWQLPDGKVAHLVLSFAAFGIATLVLAHPFQSEKESRWLAWYGRLFYFLQFPLLVLLAIAIHRRIQDYGITFERYYVVLLALWLLALTVFMVLSRNRGLVAIPYSLLLFGLLSSRGPWGVSSVAYGSQAGRLDSLLQAQDLLVNGRFQAPKAAWPQEAKSRISSIAKYLYDYDRLDTYAQAHGGLGPKGDTLTPERFTRALGFEYLGPSTNRQGGKQWFSYTAPDTSFLSGKGEFDYFAHIQFQGNPDSTRHFASADGMVVDYLPAESRLRIVVPEGDSVVIQLKEVVAVFQAQGTWRGIYAREAGRLRVMCLFEGLSGWRRAEGVEVNQLKVDLLVRLTDSLKSRSRFEYKYP